MLYASEGSNEHKRSEKQQLMRVLREDYARLRSRWGVESGYDCGCSRAKNASLAMLGTYNHLTP